MTTIVYDHEAQQIAIDSRLTRGSLICTNNDEKFIEKDGRMFFLAGAAADCELVANHYPNDCPFDDISAAGFIVDDSICKWLYMDEKTPNTFKLAFNECCGSGQDFALAALDQGKSAKEAVEYAATRDCYTGGIIRVYDIKKGCFL